jgi:hypothetical protein
LFLGLLCVVRFKDSRDDRRKSTKGGSSLKVSGRPAALSALAPSLDLEVDTSFYDGKNKRVASIMHDIDVVGDRTGCRAFSRA